MMFILKRSSFLHAHLWDRLLFASLFVPLSLANFCKWLPAKLALKNDEIFRKTRIASVLTKFTLNILNQMSNDSFQDETY